VIHKLWLLYRRVVRRDEVERDLHDELHAFASDIVQRHARTTSDPAEARRLAMIELGGLETTKERVRDVWPWKWIDDVIWDVRYALRSYRQHPGFTFVAILTLALGIGANTAVFTLANGVLFRGTPHVDPTNRLAYIQTAQGVSYADFADWRAQSRSFDGQMAAVFSAGNRTLLDDGVGPRQVYDSTQLSANTFNVLRQTPILGRDFLPSDELPGAAPVMILTYHLWERRYKKDPTIIGHTVRINSTPASWGAVDLLTSTPTTVIGVMPPDFRFPLNRVDLWLPLIRTSGMLLPILENRLRRNFMFAFGRLADGVTLQSARAEMAEVGRRLEDNYPLTNRGVSPSVKTFQEFWLGPNAGAFYTFMWAAVTFVLLIACANLANLMLAKSIGRSREMAIRIALGAGRWRIVRQLLIESVLLSVTGGLLGGALAGWSIRAYNAVASDPYAYTRWDFSVDYWVLVYLAGISVMTGLLFGLAPVARFSQFDVNSTLKESSRGAFGGRRGRRLAALLVTVEMALAIILLAGAGVMIRSVLTIATSDLGVKTTRVLTALVGLPRGRYPTAQAQIAAVQRLSDRLKAVPGTESIALASALPAGAIFHPTKRDYELADGRQLTDERLRPAAVAMAISAEYFQTLGATLYRGRAFTNVDGISSLPVAIINQRFADVAWPGEDPVGKRLRWFRGSTPGSWLTVVGVSSNIVQDDRTGQRIEPVVYQPFPQEPSTVLWVLARTLMPPASLATSVRRSIEATDADFLVGPGNSGVVAPLDEILRNNYRANSVNGSLFLIFAAIALLLASVGLHAVVAHSVSQRTHEIGIRTAMGGSARDIAALIMREGMLPVGLGLVVGLPAALALTPILKSQLVNVSPADGATLVVASVTLVVSGAIGCWLPSRRAIRVDPMVALRHE